LWIVNKGHASPILSPIYTQWTLWKANRNSTLLKKCVKIGTIGFKNSKSELSPPLRESLKNTNVSKLDQRFASNTKTCQQ
jgi:hypothetical protein